jgi:CRISPR-associated protein Cas5h
VTEIISFSISGKFSAFKDPSITTNQTVYYLPSKTAIVGMLGAMTGIKRDSESNSFYSDEYLSFYKRTKIGIKFSSNFTPKKISYFTNHRQKKHYEMKPTKVELVENPQYEIYVISEGNEISEIKRRIKNNEFEFMPYLGHAYCPAIVSSLQEYDAEEANLITGERTSAVILDEKTTGFNNDFTFDWTAVTLDPWLIIERHLHHYFEKDEFKSHIQNFRIPVKGTKFKFNNAEISKSKLSKFYKLDNEVICMY